MDDKKEKKRESRLQKIRSHLIEVLGKTSPENTDKYEIIYKPIKKYESSIFKSKENVLPSQSPAYGFFLKAKCGRGREYNIMHLFREDIDSRVSNKDIITYYQIPAFKENIIEGIKYLQTSAEKTHSKKRKSKNLEQIVGIILILSLSVSIFLMSNNVTGFTIANLSLSTSNEIGVILLIPSLIGIFFWFIKKKL